MKRTLKKSLAMLLTLVMVLSLVPAMSLTASAAATNYDTWVGSTRVTSENMESGDWTYTPADGDTAAILTFNNDYTIPGSLVNGHYGAGIYAEEPLTINLPEGVDVTVSGIVAEASFGNANGSVAIYGTGGLTIQGSGTLTATGADITGVTIGHSAGIASQTLEVKGRVSVTATGGNGTNADIRSCGVSGAVSTGSFAFANVTVSGGSLTAIGGTTGGTYVYGIYGTLKTTGTVMKGATAPGVEASTNYSNGVNVMANGYIKISFFARYPLWIGSTQVTENNMTDVLGGGKVSYDPATSTLTLANGASIDAVAVTDTNANALWTLTIVVNGTNTITGPTGFGNSKNGTDSSAISCPYANVAITGSGTLNVTGGGDEYGCNTAGVSIYDRLTIGEGVTVNATGGTREAKSDVCSTTGVSFNEYNNSTSSVIICNGILNATGGDTMGYKDSTVNYANSRGISGGDALRLEGEGQITARGGNVTGTQDDGCRYGRVYGIHANDSITVVKPLTLTVHSGTAEYGSAYLLFKPLTLSEYPYASVLLGADVATAAPLETYDDQYYYDRTTYKYLKVSPMSAIPALASLTVTGTGVPDYAPAFDETVSNYSVTVPNSVTSVTIAAQPAAGSEIVAESSDLGLKENLNEGANVFTVVATKDGAIHTYTVTVTREAAMEDQLLTALGLGVPAGGADYTYPGVIGALNAGAYPVTVDLADDALYPTDKTNLKLNFTATEGTTVYTGYTNAENPGTAVTSGTLMSLANAVTLTAVNGATVQHYAVTAVTKGAGTQQYSLELEAAGGHFNVGERVEFDVYATTPEAATATPLDIGSYQFNMSYDDTYLAFDSYTPLIGGSMTTTTAADSLTVKLVANRAIPVTCTETGAGTGLYTGRIKLGTVAFTVKNSIPEQANDITTQANANAVFALSNLEVTPNGYSRNTLTPIAETTVVTSTDGIVAHNQTVTFANGDHATVTGTPTTGYIKWNAVGIWMTNDYSTQITLPEVTPAQYYMNVGNWTVTGNAAITGIVMGSALTDDLKLLDTTARLPGNVTAQPEALEAVTVTYAIPDAMTGWGVLNGNPGPYTYGVGAKLEMVAQPTPIAADGYKLLGWSFDQTGDTILPNTYEFAWGDAPHDYTVYAIFANDSYDWTDQSGAYVTVNNLTGVAENKVTHGTDVTFTLTSADNYEITAVTYTVGDGGAQPITAGEGGVYTIPGANILGAVTLNVVTNNYIELTFDADDKYTDTGFAYTVDGGATQHAAKLYAKPNEAGFYTDKACTSEVTLAAPVTLAALGGGQYRKPVGEEPIFHDGTTGYTLAQLNAATFTENQLLTAQATAQYQVSFTISDPVSSGANFGMDNLTPITSIDPVWVDAGTTLAGAGITIPTLSLNPGYAATWAPNAPAGTDEVNSELIYTATIAHGVYAIDLTGIGTDGDITIVENYPTGVTDNTVTHGTNVVIKLDPTDADNDVITNDHISVTIGGNNYPVTPNADTGEITIPGAAITGPVAIAATTVEYHTITFASSDSATVTATMNDLIYYAVDNAAGLYSTLADLKTGAQEVYAPNAAAIGDDYRLDNKSASGQVWVTNPASTDYTTNGIFGNPMPAPGVLPTQSFTADTTLYAKTIRLYDVTFVAGTNTTLTEKPLTITVDENHQLLEAEIPTQGFTTGWVFDKWTYGTDSEASTLLGVAITADTTFTLNAKRQTFDFTYTDGQGAFTVTPVAGISEDWKVAYQAADVKFTVAQGANDRIELIRCTIGGQDYTLTPAGTDDKPYDGTYTIPAAAVTGPIALVITTMGTTNVTFHYYNDASTTAAVLPNGTLFASQLTAATELASDSHAIGQEFKGWSTDGTNVIADATILAAVVTAEANNSYTAVYGLAERTITDADTLLAEVSYRRNEVEYKTTGGEHPKLQYIPAGETGSDGYVVLTPVTTKIVTGLSYSVTDPDTGVVTGPTALTAEADGTYRIPTTVITGNITITGTVLDSTSGTAPSIEFITREQYKAITAETKGRQIMVLNGTAANETYTLGNGTVLFWSSQYNAHVCWVSDAETALSITAKGITRTGAAAARINYDGDVNGDSTVTAADAQFVNDCLHNERLVPTSAMQLFRLDVATGYKTVTSADELWILNH